MNTSRRIRQINSLRARRMARAKDHRAVRDIDARLVILIAQQLRYECREEKKQRR